MGKPNESGLFTDSLGSFEAGMNSDVPPVALPKNQLSFAANATLRGNYFTARSAYQEITLSLTDSTVQENFEEGIFQGAAYYKPDFGGEAIIASIGGRLFMVSPSSTFQNRASVIDISISGDTNSSTGRQSWLWQGENYMFCNDGESGGLYFNGNETKRLDPGTVVGTLSAPAAIPSLESSVSVTLSSNYTGQYGISVQVFPTSTSNSPIGQFQVNPAGGLYKVRLVNIDDTAGTTHISGTEVIFNPGFIGKLTAAVSLTSQSIGCTGSGTPSSAIARTFQIDTTYNYDTTILPGSDYTCGPGNFIYKGSEVWAINDTNGAARTFFSRNGVTLSPGALYTLQATPHVAMAFALGAVVTKVGAAPQSSVATLASPFTAPAQSAYIDVDVDAPYTGANEAIVFIDGAKYSISAIAQSASATVSIRAISLSQTTGSIPSGAVIKTLQQLPVGRMGVYGLGRNWVCLQDGISYIASDIVGGSSGTISNAFRDSILNVTENNFLAGGGVFRVPSSGQQINAMRFPATLDSSLGQGPLQVLTQNTTFSCNAPVQRSAWQDLTNPIQTQSLVGGGALSQNSTVAVNGDLFFRSLDGIRSLRLARQDFQTSYSNTPQSVEMNRVLLEDDRSLLGYSSAIVFDNRLLMTAAPTQSQGGVYHSKLIALNLDPNSSLRVKQPPIYDGAWEGINVLQLVVGTFNGIERAFAFTYDTDTLKIGLTEILPTSNTNLFDNGTDRIQSTFESPALFYQPDTAARQLLRLNDGEIIVKDISGDVRFDVYYRPDYDSTWRSWHSWEVEDSPNYQPRVGLGQPNLKVGDSATGRPYAVGYSFQVKVVVTGSCVVMGMNFYAVGQPTPQFAKPLEALTPLAT